jgi:serine/threonine protein kinase
MIKPAARLDFRTSKANCLTLAFFAFLPRILKSVDNPHVISTLDVFEDNTQVAIVSEFVEGGELFDRIIQEKAFTEDKAKEVMRQVLVGVEYLHSIQVVHRDIKPENILCQKREWPFQVKLTDFGLSNIIDNEKDNSNALLSHVGTSFYLAPEVVGKKGYGPGVDVWACGVVLYIMLCGRFPFWGKTDIEYLNSLQRGPDMQGEGWSSVSEEGRKFVRQLLDLNPNKRPSATEALGSPWITDIQPTFGDGGFQKLESQAGIAAVVTKRKADNANLPRPKDDDTTTADGMNAATESRPRNYHEDQDEDAEE